MALTFVSKQQLFVEPDLNVSVAVWRKGRRFAAAVMHEDHTVLTWVAPNRRRYSPPHPSTALEAAKRARDALAAQIGDSVSELLKAIHPARRFHHAFGASDRTRCDLPRRGAFGFACVIEPEQVTCPDCTEALYRAIVEAQFR